MLTIAVCGKFHYGSYARFLHEAGALDAIHFAHRIGTSLGLPPQLQHNHPLKEYLFHLHLRLAGQHGIAACGSLYHALWQRSVERVFKPSPVNLFMVHGNCTRLMAMARRAGGLVIGEAVNAHPAVQVQLLQEEARRRKLPAPRPEPGAAHMLEEFAQADLVLVPSTFVRNSFVAQGVPPRRILVLPYGVQGARQLAPLRGRDPSQPLRVLCVGQIGLRKGQAYLVEAVRRMNAGLRQPRATLTLVGRGVRDYLACLHRIAQPWRHVPHVPHARMQEFMQQHDVLVLPSLEDGFGLVVAEAMGAGLPVIVTQNAGAAELVTPGRNGLVIPAGDALALQRALEQVDEQGLPGGGKPLAGWDDYADALVRHCRGMLQPGAKVAHG